MHRSEQKGVVDVCGHRGLRWDMAQDGKPGKVRCAQKMTGMSVMWNCGRSRARKGAELALCEGRNALLLSLNGQPALS
jgi:hypothetical protein